MKRKTFDGKDGLHNALAPSASEDKSDDQILESKHKIFLSHSGAQKEFVDHLCKALEERCHYPFFDRRCDSLPKGTKFPSLIFEAAQQCQMFVVVISEDYFTSKWPMMELDAFVKATKERKSKLLPLFYGLSVSELKDEKRRERWFEEWETLARDDSKGRIKVDDWKFALDELLKFNGLPYDQESKQVVEYENVIVSHICELVPADVKWEDSHVQGNAHEVVIEKMKEVGALRLAKVKVVGLYGVGGIGKTTVCKTLCNELSSEFDWRVCHIEFDSTSSNSKELLQKVLIKLTRKSREDVQQWEEGECKYVLYKNLMKQKTFLAIDNVWDNANSRKQVKMFLEAPFHGDSLVLVTARAEMTLEHLGVAKDARFEMPDLGQGDARNLFLHYAANGQQFTSKKDMHLIDLCVKRCYFSKGGGGRFHYHPLALEALGRQVGYCRENLLEWDQILYFTWNFSAIFEENEVFFVLRTSFDLLPPMEQDLFMDVGIILQRIPIARFREESPMLWLDCLCALYNQNKQELQDLLNKLKGKGLLEDVDLSLGRISMHDLYREFVVLEAKGKLLATTSIGNQRRVYVDDGDLSKLEVTPAGGCWQNLTRLCIEQNDDQPIESLASIEWQYFPNILALHLDGLSIVKGALNLKGMKCLRSLQVHDLPNVERLEGLEGLANLTFFEWRCYDNRNSKVQFVGQFPKSLKYLFIEDLHMLLGMDVLARCSNLCKLYLMKVQVGVQLDLSHCLSLEHVKLFSLKLLTLVLPSTSKLQFLDLGFCNDLVDVQGLEQLDCLKYLRMCAMEDNYLSMTRVPTLLYCEPSSSTQYTVCHLQKLRFRISRGLIQTPKLIDFNQLQILDLSSSPILTSMFGMGQWPALRSLNLSNCKLLRWLPNLSTSKNLEEVDFDGCDTLELHEEDIQMLTTLPLLQFVPFSKSHLLGTTKLDIRRWKLLHYKGTNWRLMEDEWEEKELGQPPIQVGGYGF